MTRLFGIIGSPVTHSLSPVMHAAAFRALKIDALYAPFEVPPKDVAPMLRGLLLSGVEGLNVTVPLKERVLPLLDQLDPTAKAIGAVNTIVVRQRRVIGYNTDGIGFRRALSELGWSPRRARVVLLGAGGAARAIAWELSRVPGCTLTIANRHPARATHLTTWLKRHHPWVKVEATTLHDAALEGVDLLVNATTVGLHPTDGSLIDPRRLSSGTIVYDLIYHRTTPLVAAARRRRCVAANGLSMLLYQGAESLRLWLQRPPPVEVMRRALERQMSQGG